jgi:hypothetical protein
MTMLSRIKAWCSVRKAKKMQRLYWAGYHFAAGNLLSGRASPMGLEAMQPNDRNSFDTGMDNAIRDAIEAKICEDDRI